MFELSCLRSRPSASSTVQFPQHNKFCELDQERLVALSPERKLEGGLDLSWHNSNEDITDCSESLRIQDGNTRWVQEELRSIGSLHNRVSPVELEDGKHRVGGEEQQIVCNSKGVCQEEVEEEEEEFLCSRNITPNNIGDHVNDDAFIVAELRSCVTRNDLEKGHSLHAQIVQKGLLETNVFVGNSLVNIYAKFGFLSRAREVFEEVHIRNVVSWNGLIAGYAQHKHGDMAFHCFEQMQLDGISPNRATFLSMLKACIGLNTAARGQEVHAMIIKGGSLGNDVPVANALIDMYAKCGMLGKAEKSFNMMVTRDVVTWNSLINGYAQDELGDEALLSFKLMQEQGVLPDDITFVSVLSVCGSVGTPSIGQKIYGRVAARGSLDSNIAIATALIDMYAKSGLLVRAQEVFDNLVTRAVVTWNALIAGYVQHEQFDKACICYSQMQLNGCLPDGVTFLCMLKACGSVRAGDRGLALHDEIVRVGLCTNTAVANALIDMYGKCGLIEKAQEVFDNLVSRNVVSWNAMIAGFAEEADYNKALNLFNKMQLENFSPDTVTFVCILKVYSSMKDRNRGQEVHATIAKLGLQEEETVISNALMNLYADCGMLDEAQEVFEKLSNRNVASWNTMIDGFVEHEQNEAALKFLDYMQADGFSPNAITFYSTLKACGNMGTDHQGQMLHDTIVKHGLLESDIVVGTAVVDMYANCGMLEEAQQVFDKFSTQDGVLWNVMIAGHAQLGHTDAAFDVLELMVRKGNSPDLSTFTSIVNMCNHTGLIDICQMFFERMTTDYGISPNPDLCNCVVDLFARAGHLDEAIAMIEDMPFFASLRVWHILLGASQKCGNMKVGKMAFAQAAQLNEVDAAAYVFLSNILAAVNTEEGFSSMSEEVGMKGADALLLD